MVVKGAPERIRALATDEGRSAEAHPVVPPVAKAIGPGDEAGRRRRRRRRRGGAGSTEAPFEEDAATAAPDDLDEAVMVEREIEERAGEDSGEAQEE